MKNELDIKTLVERDDWSMHALKCVRLLGLADWWIVAGFVRSLVWDKLHAYQTRTAPGDVDVVFFDVNMAAQEDAIIERKLKEIAPSYPWEVCNQAHMHSYNDDQPYSSAVDSFCRWAETVSTIGVSLDRDDNVMIAAPHGVSDLIEMIIRPNSHPDSNMEVFRKRLIEKRWQSKWPNVSLNVP